ncbi:MAG: hypothetical protein NVS4B8_27100 [Herpetosiphon sp.]
MSHATTTIRTAIAYARDIPNITWQAQLAGCLQYTDSNGLILVASTIDYKRPGSTYRLGLRGAFEMLAAGDARILVALNSLVITNNPLRLQSIRDLLHEQHCELHIIDSL